MKGEVGPSIKGGASRDEELLLLLSLTLATVGVASGTDLYDVTNDALNNCADTGNKKNEANPVVPYIRCEHVSKRSQCASSDGYFWAIPLGVRHRRSNWRDG